MVLVGGLDVFWFFFDIMVVYFCVSHKIFYSRILKWALEGR